MHRLIEHVDFLVARGGFNTITEILFFKKPALLIYEKNNPEIKENLNQMYKLGYCAIMEQASFKSKFVKKINYFINKQLKNIQINLNSKNIKTNGANQILNDIIKDYAKN